MQRLGLVPRWIVGLLQQNLNEIVFWMGDPALRVGCRRGRLLMDSLPLEVDALLRT
jgi:hypothetical protein